MEDSELIKKAKSLIEAVKGKKLTLIERKDEAIALAAIMIEEAKRIQTRSEKRQQTELAGMMRDPMGKIFITMLTDQCFRSHSYARIADQLTYVIKKLGVPSYLSKDKRIALLSFAAIGRYFSAITVPVTMRMIRKQTNNVILPGEEDQLLKHMRQRRVDGVRVNLNHLGEAILGENEALHRLQINLEDLAKPDVEYISVKISTIFSQINLLAWHDTLRVLSDRLRQLYRAAMKHRYVRPDGISVPKFVNLDMEEYRDLHLTVALFCQVLDEPEFYHHEAGIVLQSYLPDSFLIQQKLTVWAMQRLTQGGAPIKIRIVKGANLAMEQVESALHLWPQAPYTSKEDVDANFKRMVFYGCQKHHAQAAHIGIGSHNLFDVAYALLLRAENQVEKTVNFEMLEGMADHIRRVVQQLSGDMLLYCPIATKEEFQNAVAYLVRRLDENTAPENFLRHVFDLTPGTQTWKQQAELFANACLRSDEISRYPRRTQNRQIEISNSCPAKSFENEADTDWSLHQNRLWAERIIHDWKAKVHVDIPLVINGENILNENQMEVGEDPSHPDKTLYRYALANEAEVELALEAAKNAEVHWQATTVEERAELLSNIGHELRLHRADLIGAMIADTGKTVFEADVEVSEAIDFAEYYRVNLMEWHHLPDIEWKSKGTVLIAPPWNFPCSISAGGIIAALATGNCVIFKPAPEAVLVGWYLVQLFWKAGVNRAVLQFLNCKDEPVGSLLVKDPRISAVVLTGATSTAKKFLRMRPGLDLLAETGGKNIMVISAMADRDLAIKDLLQSAFGHAGQKCSACSLAILEAEVYDDPHFLQQLCDATSSLHVGSQWSFKTKINPLIYAPNPTLLRGLTQLDSGEKWLLQPQQDFLNPQLWSPGIKIGVTPSSFTFQQELFGPVLGLVRADSFAHALEMINLTPYGLTAGIQSLDEREQNAWLNQVEAGNCYVNRTITGAIVERQPFGGCKESSFGKGAKAGGPNYLLQLMNPEQIALPDERAVPNSNVQRLSEIIIKKLHASLDETTWKASIGSYAFYWNEYFSQSHDPCLVVGQDNLQCYKPRLHLSVRAQKKDSPLDVFRILAAALTCGAQIDVSIEDETLARDCEKLNVARSFVIRHETDGAFIKRIQTKGVQYLRVLHRPSPAVLAALAETACNVHVGPVMANGRIELLHFLREVSISRNYHRYGNLGARENERRKPIPGNFDRTNESTCENCECHE